MKKSTSLLLWSVIVVFSFSCAPRKTTKENCKQYFEKAHEFIFYNPLYVADSGKVYLEKTIACSTDFVDAYLMLAILYTKDEQYAQAESTYKLLIENNPRNAKEYLCLGRVFIKMKRFDDAIAECEKGLSIDSNDASIYHSLGFAYEEMGEFTKAESLYEIAHRMEPTSQPISYALAGTYLKNGKCEKAIPMIEKLQKEYPEDREVMLMLGDAYYDCRDYSKALEEYLRLPTFPPKSASIYLKIGKCYEDLKQYDNAAANLDTAIEKSENKLISYYHIINMYIQAGKYEKAQKYAKKALHSLPNDSGLCNLMGDIYIEYGDRTRANEQFNAAVNHYQNAKAWFKKAQFSGEGGIHRANQKIRNILKTAGMIKGKIICGLNGDPLPFSNVIIVGTTKGTVSDLNGDYYFILSQGIYDIQVRMMGYVNPVARNVKAKAGETTIVNFELEVEKIKNPKAIIYAPSPP